jgi:hypothetical protein
MKVKKIRGRKKSKSLAKPCLDKLYSFRYKIGCRFLMFQQSEKRIGECLPKIQDFPFHI